MMKINFSKSMIQKIALFILSMSLFFVIVGLLCMDLPICLDGEFLGWSQLWMNTRVGLLIIMLTILIEVAVYWYLKYLWDHTAQELSVNVVKVEEHNYDSLAFIASFMIPLVSFQLHQMSHWIVMMLLVVVVGIIVCNSKGYYTNPTLVLFGFHLYKLTIETQQVEKKDKFHEKIMISREPLDASSKFRYVKITDDVGFVL